MTELPAWDELLHGKGCPLCAPREKYTQLLHFVTTLSVSSLYLSANQAYRGTCALIYDLGHAVHPGQLDSDQWRLFADDLRRAEAAVRQVFSPDHMNLESLGNSVPHLHFHIVPRYKNDPRWGHPIWMSRRTEMPDVRLQNSEYVALARDIDLALNVPHVQSDESSVGSVPESGDHNAR